MTSCSKDWASHSVFEVYPQTLLPSFIGLIDLMKLVIPTVLMSFVFGLIAQNLLIPEKINTDFDATAKFEFLESEIGKLMQENTLLRGEIKSLKDQLPKQEVAYSDAAPTVHSPVYQPTDLQLQNLKKEWIEASLSRGSPIFQRHSDEELNQMIQDLNLTPDQAREIKLLFDKRNQIRQLNMMLSTGSISEEEHQALFADLSSFDFDIAVNSLLSPDQLEKLKSIHLEQQEQGVQRYVKIMSDRLKLNEGNRFDELERNVINKAIEIAINADFEVNVPSVIQELQINGTDKRILAVGFQQLDNTAFEQLYQSVVGKYEDGEG